MSQNIRIEGVVDIITKGVDQGFVINSDPSEFCSIVRLMKKIDPELPALF